MQSVVTLVYYYYYYYYYSQFAKPLILDTFFDADDNIIISNDKISI